MPLNDYWADRQHLVAGISKKEIGEASKGNNPALLERIRAFTDDGSWSAPSGVEITDSTIAGLYGEIPIRIYRSGTQPSSYLLWVHGGGFLAGELDWPESHVVSAELAAAAHCTVIAVDYRLASQTVRYPVPLDDVRSAWVWMKNFAEDEGVAGASLAMGGASAGAALALATALGDGAGADLLLLAYPFAHFPVPALDPSVASDMQSLPDLLRFSPAEIEHLVETYVGRVVDIPRDALPGHARLDAIRSRVLLVVAELDDLRPSAELLARQLVESGVEVVVRTEVGVPHGHLNRLPAAEGTGATLEWLASELRAASSSRF